MTAGDLLRRASRELNDVERVRWPLDALLDFLNDAVRQIVLTRPEASARRLVLDLAPGARQRLPEGCLRLLDCLANVAGTDGSGEADGRDGPGPDAPGSTGGADATTRGSVVRRADRDDFDRCQPGWRVPPAAADFDGVSRFFLDERLPREFDVYPAVPESVPVRLEAIVSALPEPCAEEDDAVGLGGDEWTEPLLRWVLYRACSVDSPSRESRDRAAFNLQSFWQAMSAGGGR